MQTEFLNEIAHRPWPLPTGPWTVFMRWEDLLFAHWPVAFESLRPLIPSYLELDSFDGSPWLSVVPFRMEGTHLRGLPPVPGTSSFPELNVRTYVTANDRPGVWFFSLDAANRLAVRAARRFFHLPYFDASMRSTGTADYIEYSSRRTHADAPVTEFEASFCPVSDPFLSKPGTLEHWLTERYCFYAADAGDRIWRGDIHHVPWPLQLAEARITKNTMGLPLGINLSRTPIHLHFARTMTVVGWRMRPS